MTSEKNENPLIEVRNQAISLSATALSEPWAQSEQKIARYFPGWREVLVKAIENPEVQKDKNAHQWVQTLNESIGLVSRAIQTRDAVLLSNTLADSFVPGIEALSKY